MLFSAESVLGLINDGRFLDALSHLQKTHVRPEDPERDTYVSLLADSLHLTGQTEAAERLAQQICKTRTARPSTLARCHLVLGSICRDRGDLRRSFWHSEKAFTFAEAGRNPELACWARLHLMMVKGETDGAEAAIGMLPEIRRRVASVGNPILLATLHLWVAEFESKRGLLASATRHIHMGRAILRRHHNVWLEGSAAIDDFCVAFLKSDVEAAFSFASKALAAASVSGHAATRMAACTNLAHIHLTYGEFDKAKEYFDEALGCCLNGGANQVAVLDGLAQLEMARCNFSKCEEYLNKIDEFRETVSSHLPGYYQSWSFHTKLRLLISQQRIDEAQELIKSLRLVFHRFHPSLRLGLRRLHAELLLVNRDYCAASGVLYKAYTDCDRQSPEAFAYISLTIGKTLVGLDLPSIAAFHLLRSIRIFEHLKQSAGAKEAAAAFSTIPTNLTQPVSQKAFPVTEGQPTFTDHCDSRGGSRERVLDQIAALIELEEAPELLGQEVFELFRQLDCTERLVLVRDAATRREVVACDGNGSDLADNHVGSAELVLHVGTDENNNLSVRAIPRANVVSQLDCAAAFKVVSALVELRTLRREAQERLAIWPADEVVPTEAVVFAAAPMVEMLRTLRKIAPSNVTVLITGETGTGKEVFARALHQYSNRAEKLFTAFNCAAVPRDLIESQLFGYRRGAFSGAHDGFEGVVRATSGGSLFLDEIGEIPQEIQPKLLRFLESNEVHPLGEPKPIRIDVRVIAATNADLEQSVARGVFREDLFYRLNVVRFRIPPLRERREEIPRLVRHFLYKYSEEYFKSGLTVAEQAIECLLLYGWPGNIRQLANEMRRLVALADNDAVLNLNDLSPELTADLRGHPNQQHPIEDTELSVSLNQPLNSAVEQLERAMLRHALNGSQWRVNTAARALGLSRKGLYLKRMRLGMVELRQ